MNNNEEIFQTELDDTSDKLPGDPLSDFADRIIGTMKDIMPPSIPAYAGFTPPELEHIVRIFRFSDPVTFNPPLLEDVRLKIEALINDRWHCAHDIVCNDIVIMFFTRPKEAPQDEQQTCRDIETEMGT